MGYPTNKPKLLLRNLTRGDVYVCANGDLIEYMGLAFYSGPETKGERKNLPEFRATTGRLSGCYGSWDYDGTKLNARDWPANMNIVRRA
jgi:hypothetical protein